MSPIIIIDCRSRATSRVFEELAICYQEQVTATSSQMALQGWHRRVSRERDHEENKNCLSLPRKCFTTGSLSDVVSSDILDVMCSKYCS